MDEPSQAPGAVRSPAMPLQTALTGDPQFRPTRAVVLDMVEEFIDAAPRLDGLVEVEQPH